MSLSNLYPSISPSLSLDFAAVKKLDSRVTFTRTTTATYYGTETAKAEENLLLQSQDFTTSWTNSNTTDTANTEVAPDGTTTADTITANAGNSNHYIFQTETLSALTYAYSIFAKAGTTPYLQLSTSTQNAFANFDLTAGSGATGTNGGVVSSSIIDVGNGWYRCQMIVTISNGNNFVIAIQNSSSDARQAAWTALGTETVFLWGAQLEQRSAVSAYTPTTTQPITNYIPVLETAASGVARFDHNPTTFESLGLLVEEQRTNLLTYSAEFDNAAWTKSNSSITANTIVAPDGTLTGDKFVSDSGQTGNINKGSISFTSGTAVTASFYAKKGEFDTIILRVGSVAFTGAVAARTVTFNLTSGTVTTTGATWTSGSMTAVGNGWYRCIGTVTPTSTASDTLFLVGNNTGDGYSGIYLWGAQLEEGAFPTSYIATTSASVTRNADVASMTGTNFSSWYTGGAGTVYSESAVYSTNIKTQGVWQLGGGATTTSLRSPQATTARLRAAVGGTFSGAGTGAVISNNTFIKAAVAWQGLSGRLQSGATGEDVTGAANLDAIRFEIGALGGTELNGHIRKLAFYPARLTNAQLVALTS